MKLSLDNLQAQIINGLIGNKLEDLNICSGKDYFSVTFETTIKSVSDLVGYFHCSTKFYFKNKSDDCEFLTLGSLKTYTSLYDFEEISKVIDENDCLKIVGAQRFQQERCAIEWHGLEDCHFTIPYVSFERNYKKSSIEIKLNIPKETIESEQAKKEYLYELANILDPRIFCYREVNNYPISKEQIPTKEDWQRIVTKGVSSLDKVNFTKVVLSRKQVIRYKRPICADEFFKDFNSKVRQKSYCIYFQLSNQQKFLSFTPETLFKIKNKRLTLDSLAGTRSRGQTKDQDDVLESQLKSDEKELSEHRFVTQYIKAKMKDFVSGVNTVKDEEILKQTHVQHIHTLLEGALKDETKIFDLIKSFHPTPAVGGTPKERALELISELEPYTRGLYAAPIGYLSKDNSELAVAIRCALINGENLHIYGGCGIVQQSQWLNEWNESMHKMRNFQSALKVEN